MELWDIHDKNRNKTGKTIVRGKDKLGEGEYHIVVFIAVFNSEGKMLIQQRQPFKEGWSGYWDITAGGSATSGDTSAIAASRELYEEVGISVDFGDALPHFTINLDNFLCDFYLHRQDVDIDSLVLGYDEVAQVKWATKQEIFDMMDEGSFVPAQKGTIELCFGLNERRSTLTRDSE
ncbi:MAG: NUDIX domain-containing protein [Defluviitaleaceae bacterium]|nr:NUDIX domain-containing protein [Defluviitaleaceae bacterium]